MNALTAQQAPLFALPPLKYVESDEWYTPPVYIDAARRVMGSIQLDPASCAIANETVLAENFYTREQDGLALPLYGNPTPWVERIRTAIMAGTVTQAIMLLPPSVDTDWFQLAVERGVAGAICLVRGRIQFLRVDGRKADAPRQGNVFVYYGDRVTVFRGVFGEYGRVFSL